MGWKELYHTALQTLQHNEDAEAIVSRLVENLSGMSRFKLWVQPDTPVDKKSAELFYAHLERLKNGEPLQYVLGYAYFLDMKIGVNPAVLIPRPETEELVMLTKQKYTATPPAKAIDFCTGSGCIALALKKLFPTAEVWATDVSEKALETARHNAKDIFGTNDAIRFLKHDLLQETTLPENPKFDLIVSNPPYIAKEEAAAMHPSVLDFEPHLALFPENNDPIVFYRRLLAMAQSHLNPDGTLLCEINPRYASELIQLGENAGFTSSVIQDLSGKKRFWEIGFR